MKTVSEELLRLSGWLSQQADYWDNQDYHSAKPRYVEKANYVRDLAARCEVMVSLEGVEEAIRDSLQGWLEENMIIDDDDVDDLIGDITASLKGGS